MNIAVIGNQFRSLVNFRAHLILTLANRGHRIVVLTPDVDEALVSRLSHPNITRATYFLNRTGTNPIKDTACFLSLRKALRTIKPDLVFSYSSKPVIYGSLAASSAKVPKITSMVTGGGYAFTDVKSLKRKAVSSIVRSLYRKALCKNDHVIFQNKDELKLFRATKLLPASVNASVVDGSGVDVDYFKAVVPNRAPFTFVMVARVLIDKGTREFVEAARQVRAKYPTVRFQLVGAHDENPGRVPLAEIEQWKRDGVIEYVGEVDDVRPYLQNATAFVLPSYNEGLPRSSLEALATGLPIITTDAPGCRETVQAGVNGFLVEVKNAQQLAQAIFQMIAAPSLIGPMGEASRKLAEDRFDIRKINAKMAEALGL